MTCNGASGLCIADPGDAPLDVDGNQSEANSAHGLAIESGTDISLTKNKVTDNTLNALTDPARYSIRPLDSVTVKGKIKRGEDGSMSILASGMYVRK